MRERIQNLSLFRKLMLILFAAMLLIFTVIYLIMTVRNGSAGQNALLPPEEAPALAAKGSWLGWVCGTIMCVSAAVKILFGGDLFRWRVHLETRDTDEAEPSNLAVALRSAAWVLAAVVALIAYVMGLLAIPPV